MAHRVRVSGPAPDKLMKKTIAITLVLIASGAVKPKKPEPQRSPLEQYIEQTMRGVQSTPESSPGSLFTRTGQLADGFRDLRASRLYDLVTIIVADKASAVSTGVTNTSRKSSAKASVTALGGVIKATRPLAN